MTRRSRLYLKRKVAQARNDLDRALAKVAYLHREFAPVHPDYGQLLEAIGKGLILQKGLIERFWVLAFGSEPEDWETYVGAGKKR